MLLLKKFSLSLFGLILMTSLAHSKQDTIEIKNQWVLATHEGQNVGAAFLTILSKEDTSLIFVETDVAQNVEIHSMTMEGGVMKMRMLDRLTVTANKPTKLTPSGFHLMLFNLRKPLVSGEKANFTLHFRNKVGQEKSVSIVSPIKPEAP